MMVVFPHLLAIGQFEVHPSARIVSHSKDKKLPRTLPAQPTSKVIGT